VENNVIIVGNNHEEWLSIRDHLIPQGYAIHLSSSLDEMEHRLGEIACLAAIIDIDSIEVDNHTIRRLTISYPGTSLLCVSLDKFHPELKDAICYHIYACLNKPVDLEELLYWLQCIRDDDIGSRGS
jgi:DNA-binding NtrC family response regulator